MLRGTFRFQVKEKIVGKLDGKIAVITGGSTGMALAGARLFVDEGAHVFIQARRQDALDDAVKLIGRNVTAVQGDAADLDDLDRLYDTVKQEKGSIDVLWASAGMGEPAQLGEISLMIHIAHAGQLHSHQHGTGRLGVGRGRPRLGTVGTRHGVL